MALTATTAAEKGHNLLILGSAGAGKSFLIRKNAEKLGKADIKVQLTGTTGFSASLLPNGMTIHKFLGLKDGRYSNQELSNKVLNDTTYSKIKNNILNTNCIIYIIDEISMFSWKMFEQIEHVCRTVRNNRRPFGGIQLILSGDFYQLKPVANSRYNDLGEIIISKPEFSTLIPHFVVLTEVHRQSEETLITAIHELSRGCVSARTADFMNELKRPFTDEHNPVKLFAQNYDVDKCNSDNLLKLGGIICSRLELFPSCQITKLEAQKPESESLT